MRVAPAVAVMSHRSMVVFGGGERNDGYILDTKHNRVRRIPLRVVDSVE